MHVANVEALRRAVALLDVPPAYVLTDGFPVDGLGAPGLAIWKGDRVAACIAAASVLAKVTRDRIMTGLDEITLALGPYGHRWLRLRHRPTRRPRSRRPAHTWLEMANASPVTRWSDAAAWAFGSGPWPRRTPAPRGASTKRVSASVGSETSLG